MKIISKYVLEEHAGPFAFALTALTSLLLLQYIARRFGDLVGKGLPWRVIAEFFFLSIPFTVAMTLPMAVLVAVLYAFSRLASENEITALKAGGVSMRQLMVPVLGGAFVLAIAMLGFNDQILPRANHRLAVLQMDIFRTKPTFALKEQVINAVKEGQLYLRAGRLDEGSSRMRDVVIYDLADPVRRRTIYADSGAIGMARNHSDLTMTLYHGVIQTVPTDKPGELTRIFYEKSRRTIPGVASQFQATESADTVSKGDREMSVCEMQTALAQADSALQRADWTAREAEWEETLASKRGPKPAPLHIERTVGIGGLYCGMLAGAGRLLGIGRSTPTAAAAAPPARPMHSMSAMSDLAPSAGGLNGLPAGQRLSVARMNAQDAQLKRNRYDVEIQKKFSLAAACVIFVLVGAPVALRFPRGGVGLVIGVSFFIFALYYVGLIGGEALSDRNLLSPFWAMWATNVAMGVVGLALTSRMGTEASTARGGDLHELLASLRLRIARIARRLGIPMERRRLA
ncbi:MAG TPA: LptF/LptG family permease [Gemmatimonadaceae bacterium]|nr:LptF/LptG family permease [Gemmatimonadaceae bacterium]